MGVVNRPGVSFPIVKVGRHADRLRGDDLPRLRLPPGDRAADDPARALFDEAAELKP
jgi:hypothetical protein